MTALKHTTRTDQFGVVHHVAAGPAGVVEFIRHPHLPGAPADLIAHAPRPDHPDDEPTPGCPYLDGPCYPRTSGEDAERLAKRWEAAERNDVVIWAGLQDWYHRVLIEDGGGA